MMAKLSRIPISTFVNLRQFCPFGDFFVALQATRWVDSRPMEDQSEHATAPELKVLGSRLRSLRSAKGWTLEELAERSGLSKPFLSRLESGDRQPSIAAVLTLARVFGVPMGSLFDVKQDDDSCLVVRVGMATVQHGNGIEYIPLSGASRFNLQPMRAMISPLRKGSEHYQHEGEEWLYVLSGRLRLQVGDREYQLEKGDAAHFDSRQPHRLDALDGHEAEVILVACPIPTTLISRRETGQLMTAGLLG
jgi:transcriptional regulator with XRE-family HTH domain